MKKLLSASAIMLLCFLAYSQEAESAGSTAGLTIIPQAEFSPSFSTRGESGEIQFGNTSIYTLFEGNASEHFSWTIANHWFSLADKRDLGWLYRNTWRSDSTNWVDYLYGRFTFGGWSFTVGKNMVMTGGFESDDWDWDVTSSLTSPLWSSLNSYQWGGTVEYTTPSEKTRFILQAATSPFGERPFASGLKTFSGMWRGEYGWFSNIWSVSALEFAKGRYDWVFALGQRAEFGKWTITLDWNNVTGADEEGEQYCFNRGCSVLATVMHSPSEKIDWYVKGLYAGEKVWGASAFADWYPLRDSRDLRLRGSAGYSGLNGCVVISLGAVWNFNVKLW